MKTNLFSRKSILSAFLAVTTAALLYSATAQSPKQETVRRDDIYICHLGKTIKIERAVWPTHKAHGDNMQPCQPIDGPHDPAD